MPIVPLHLAALRTRGDDRLLLSIADLQHPPGPERKAGLGNVLWTEKWIFALGKVLVAANGMCRIHCSYPVILGYLQSDADKAKIWILAH